MRERRSSAETQSLSQPVGIQLRMSDRVSVWSCCLDEEINIVTMKENLSDRQTRSPMLECFCCNCADCSFFFFFRTPLDGTVLFHYMPFVYLDS